MYPIDRRQAAVPQKFRSFQYAAYQYVSRGRSRTGKRFTFYAGMGGNKRRSTGLCRSLYRTAVWLGIYRAWNNRSDYYTASEKTASEG